MNADWPLVTIDSIKADSKGSIAIGPFGSRMKSDCYVDDGIPVIRGTNITGGPTFEGNFVYITQDKADSLGSSNVYQYDLVFPHRGSIGEVGIILDDKRYVISSSLMKLTCDRERVNPKFLYYFFKSSIGRHELLKNSSQVGTPGIGQPLSSLKSIEFRLPPLRIQDQIEEMLTSLDTKIELNRQTNQTLEQIAQAIFKNWFVDFEPVKAKAIVKEKGGNELAQSLAAQAIICGVITLEQLQKLQNDFIGLEAQLHPLIIDRFPDEAGLDYWSPGTLQTTAALFPDVLVESELGEIPEGWVAKPLGKYVEIKRGGSPRPIKDYIVEKGLPWTKIADATAESSPFLFRTKECIKEEGLKKTVLLKKGTLILSNSATPGLPKFLELDACIHDGWLHFPKKELFSDLYLFQLFLEIKKELIAQGNGSVFTNLKTDILRNQVVVAPTIEILNKFDELVSLVFEKVKCNCKEINTLTSIRDILLPKLLSGELALNNVKTTTEAVTC